MLENAVRNISVKKISNAVFVEGFFFFLFFPFYQSIF